MHDIVIRGGTIVDGTGTAAFTGDVAIAGARIAEVGGAATGGADRDCRSSSWSSARPARPRISSACTTAAGWRRVCVLT
jgi:hypothetical protein